MMAQPQLAQGCAVCGAPSDPLDERREPAKRAVCWGRRPLVTLGLSKVTRPSPKGGRNPCEGKALASLTLSHISQTDEPKKLATPHPGPLPQGEREADRKPLRLHGRDHKQKPQPKGCGFLLGQPADANGATGLRHGASWSCRRCLPALCPSR